MVLSAIQFSNKLITIFWQLVGLAPFSSGQPSLNSEGNHELYITDIAYLTFNGFSKVYGDRYITSNVQIKNPSTGEFEYIGSRYRYFTTMQGNPSRQYSILLKASI